MCGTHLVPGVAHEIIGMNHVPLFRACLLRKACWGTFSLAVNLHFVLAKSNFCRFLGADLHFCWSTHLFRGFALAGDAVGSAESLRVLAKAQQVQVSDVWREELHEIPQRFEDPKGDIFIFRCAFWNLVHSNIARCITGIKIIGTPNWMVDSLPSKSDSWTPNLLVGWLGWVSFEWHIVVPTVPKKMPKGVPNSIVNWLNHVKSTFLMGLTHLKS